MRGLTLTNTLLAAVAALVLAPFALAVLVSLMEPASFMARQPSFWPLRVTGYAGALSHAPFGRYFLNSLLVSTAITAGSLLTSILAAYVFARAEFPGRDVMFGIVVATLMIPGHVTLIPNYLTLAKLGLVDSYAALILPFLASGLVTFFLRQHFKSIPRELDDAALIDGAGHGTILWRILVPIARPAIASMALFQFLAEWNSYLWPLIVTSSDRLRTVQIGLAQVFATEAFDGLVDWPMIMAGAVMVMAPTLAVFWLAERDLTRGIAVSVAR